MQIETPAQAPVIDGKAIAAEIRAQVAADVRELSQSGVTPGLAVVLVGDDPASQVYVRNKGRQTLEAGMRSFEHKLAAETSEDELLALVRRLNADHSVHGILVQMPLPKHINPDRVVFELDPAKDVDGLHPINAGRIVLGKPGLVPCTPQGCVILARHVLGEDLSGLDVVVIGRSILVGKPVSLLFQNANCTVTMAHSRTRDLALLCRRADILVAAVGRSELVRGSWIKPGATVIDVGINRIVGRDGRSRLVGDVAFEEARQVARAITPVPGGVGPMTIACLLLNTVQAARMITGAPRPS